jgi:hypothetical protein
MTDKEKDKLIVEALGKKYTDWAGSIWPINGDGQLGSCLDTWEGFGWLWERAQKMEWWESFMDWIYTEYAKGYKGPEFNRCAEYFVHPPYSAPLHPIRFRDALAEFLEARK